MYKEVVLIWAWLMLQVKMKTEVHPLSLEIGMLKQKYMSLYLEQSAGGRQHENLVHVKYSLAEMGDKLSMNLKKMLTSTQYYRPNPQSIFKLHLNI